MTVSTNAATILVTTESGVEIEIPVREATKLIADLLEARKTAYESVRLEKATANAAKKETAAKAKIAKAEEAAKKSAARLEKLKAQIADLEKKAKTKA